MLKSITTFKLKLFQWPLNLYYFVLELDLHSFVTCCFLERCLINNWNAGSFNHHSIVAQNEGISGWLLLSEDIGELQSAVNHRALDSTCLLGVLR